jgi:hypothetical protein
MKDGWAAYATAMRARRGRNIQFALNVAHSGTTFVENVEPSSAVLAGTLLPLTPKGEMVDFLSSVSPPCLSKREADIRHARCTRRPWKDKQFARL